MRILTIRMFTIDTAINRFLSSTIYWIEPGLSPSMREVVKQSLAVAEPCSTKKKLADLVT